MRLFVVLVMLGTALAASALACGPSNDKPPLQPDPTSSSGGTSDEAGAPAPPGMK